MVSHPTIDAVRYLRDEAGVNPEQVTEIRAQVNPYVLELMGKREPSVGLEGKFSIFHCAAIGYVERAARVRQFTDEAVRRPDIVALRSKVVAEVDPTLPTSAARVRLTSADGRTWEHRVDAASGTPHNPLSDQELREKFSALIEERLSPEQGREAADQALSAEGLANVRDLVGIVARDLSRR